MRYAYIILGVVLLLVIIGAAIMYTRQSGVVAYNTYGGANQGAYQAQILPAVNNDNVIIRGQYPVVGATTPVYQQPVYAQSPVYSTAVPAYVGYLPMTPMVWYNAPTQSSIVYGSSYGGYNPYVNRTAIYGYGQPTVNYGYQYQYSDVYPQPNQVYSYSYGSNSNYVNPAYYNPGAYNGANPQWSGTWYSTPGYSYGGK